MVYGMRTSRSIRRTTLAAVGVVVLALGGTIAGVWATSHSAPVAPYPLGIPLAKRNPTQLLQGRLMLAPHLVATRQVVPVPPAMAKHVSRPDVVAMVRFSLTAPTLDWTDGPSLAPTVLSVSASTASLTSGQVAARTQTACWVLAWNHGQVRYGESGLRRPCAAPNTPTSGWHTQWPAPSTRGAR